MQGQFRALILISMIIFTFASNQWQNGSAPYHMYSRVAVNADAKYIAAVAIDFGVVVSNDYGATWHDSLKFDRTDRFDVYHDIAIGDDGEAFFVCWHSKVFISKDKGLTWKETLDVEDINKDLVIRSLTIDASGQKVIISVMSDDRSTPGDTSLYLSNDFGRTFKKSNVASSLGISSDMDGVVCSKSCEHIIGYSRFQKSIFSNDFGRSWNEIAWRQWDDDAAVVSEFTAVAINEDGAYMYGLFGSTVLRSVDNGKTWKNSNAPLGNNFVGLATDSSGQTVIAIPSYGTMSVSTDFGLTWSRQFTLPVEEFYDIAVTRGPHPTWVAATSDSILFLHDKQ